MMRSPFAMTALRPLASLFKRKNRPASKDYFLHFQGKRSVGMWG
jgi:hypothetical protein